MHNCLLRDNKLINSYTLNKITANVLQWVWCFTNITEWSDKIKQYLGSCNGFSTKGFGGASRRLRWPLNGNLHQRVPRVCYKGGNSNTEAWGRTIVSTPGIIYIKKKIKIGQQTLLSLKIKHIFYDFHKCFCLFRFFRDSKLKVAKNVFSFFMFQGNWRLLNCHNQDFIYM